MAQILQLDSRFRAGFVSRSAAGLAIPDTRLRSLRSRTPTSSCCLAANLVSGRQERRRSAGEIVEKNRDLFGAVTGKDLSEEPPSRLDNCVGVQVELGHELDGDPSAISVGSNAPYVTGTLQPIDQAGRRAGGEPGAMRQLPGRKRPGVRTATGRSRPFTTPHANRSRSGCPSAWHPRRCRRPSAGLTRECRAARRAAPLRGGSEHRACGTSSAGGSSRCSWK